MGSRQLVTAAVVAMFLGSAWPVGAETPQTKEQEEKRKAAQQKGKTPAGPTNSAPSQDKPSADTPGGVLSKEPKVGGASGRIPGIGEGAKAQDPTTTTTAPMPAANTLFDPNQPRPQGNTPPGTKVVTPDSFKSKEERLNELANPGTPAPETSPAGGDATKKMLERSGSDVLGSVSTTVAPGAGKNPSTTRQQQSEDAGTTTTSKTVGSLTVTGTQDKSGSTFSIAGNSGSVTFRYNNDFKLTNETVKTKDKDGITLLMVTDYTKATTTRTITITVPTGEVYRQVNDGALKRIKMPNPETDTGSNVPKGPLTGQEPPQKSPSELAAERLRQVTDGLDDQRRQLERMKMDANVALKSAMGNRTDGRIDPGRDGTPDRGGFSGPIVDTRPRGVDGLPKTPPKGPTDFGRPVTQPRGGGTTPDNPTASGGTGQTTTGSEPPRR